MPSSRRRWKEAERDASTALDLDPENVKALFRRATARRELELYTSAKFDCQTALRLGAGLEVQAELDKVEVRL